MSSSRKYSPLQRRAANMVWTAAGDYSFDPPFLAFLQNGKPDFYMNSIVGYVHKWLDPAEMGKLFDTLGNAALRDMYDGLLWVALENCVYEKEAPVRPALPEMRAEYARLFFDLEKEKSRQQWMSQNSLVYDMQSARWRRVLGKSDGLLNPWERRLSEDLAFSGSLDAAGVRERILEIFAKYFHFHGKLSKDLFHFTLHGLLAKALPSGVHGASMLRTGLSSGNGGAGDGFSRREEEGSEAKDRQYIEDCFGVSFLSPDEGAQAERLLCTGNHYNCHIYFAGGDHGTPRDEEQPADERAGAPRHRREAHADTVVEGAREQEIRNRRHFTDRKRQYENSISGLCLKIQNAVQVSSQPTRVRGRRGLLDPAQVWRASLLNDGRVFQSMIENPQPDFSVDLLLDASASRMGVQEIIASQAYVIAESLHRCGIPVEVCSFLSLRGFTVMNLLCSYEKNADRGRIFKYYAAGWNRDGLALRGSRYLMSRSPAKQKILIVLTDAAPNDDRRLPADREQGRLLSCEYSGDAGILDTSREVKELRRQGIRVVAVLTGGEDTGGSAGARKIYGDDFVKIQNIDQLSAAVGELIQRQIWELTQ